MQELTYNSGGKKGRPLGWRKDTHSKEAIAKKRRLENIYTKETLAQIDREKDSSIREEEGRESTPRGGGEFAQGVSERGVGSPSQNSSHSASTSSHSEKISQLDSGNDSEIFSPVNTPPPQNFSSSSIGYKNGGYFLNPSEASNLIKKNVPVKTIKTTSVFDANLSSDSKVICDRGGARSSKSYSIAQLIVERFLGIPGRRILIVRKTMPSLRITTLPLIYETLDNYGYKQKITEEKVAFNILFGKSLIHFSSLDDPEKIHSSEWNDIWMEEATEFTYEDFITLKLRTSAPDKGIRNQLFLSFNPIDEYHWIKSNILDAHVPDCTEIVSNYKCNPFLSADYIQTLEALKDQDRNFYRIFAEGEWGRLEHVIYKNWYETADFSIPVSGDNTFYGLDFGFNSPTSLVEVRVDARPGEASAWRVEANEIIYEAGLTNSALIEKMKVVIPEDRRRKFIYPDCAEPQRIEELRSAGFRVEPAEKDVLDGIDFCKRFRIGITSNSINGLKEIRGYSYRVDRQGKVLDEPVKYNDHFIDAFRYALYTHGKKFLGGRPRIRSFTIKADGEKEEK